MNPMYRESQLSLDQYARLGKLHLHYNLPEPAIICTLCGYALAVDDDRVGRHLGEKHGIPKGTRRKLNTLINSLQLPNPEALPKRPDGSAPHPHLQVREGKACKHCGLRSTSSTVLSQHIRKLHRHEITATKKAGKHWLRDHIVDNLAFQSWTLKDIKRAWSIRPAKAVALGSKESHNRPLQPVRDSIQCFADQLLHQERSHLGLDSAELDSSRPGNITPAPALLTNWLRRTGWERTFEGARCDILVSLSVLPVLSSQPLSLGFHHDGTELRSSVLDESKLLCIVEALDRLFDQCGTTVRFTDVSVRRWLRSRFPDHPYKAPFELVSQASSERLYRIEFKRCICFWLRLWRLPTALSRLVMGRTFLRSQHRMLQQLWLDSCWVEYSSRDVHPRGRDIRSSCQLQYGIPAKEVGEEQEDHEEKIEEDVEEDDNETILSEYEDSADSASSSGKSDEEHDSDSHWCEGSDASSSLSGTGQSRSQQVLARVKSGAVDESVDALLRFCYQMVTEDFNDGRSNSTLLVYFSAVRGLSKEEGNEYLRPARFTPILSRLIYCTRLIFLEAILPQHAHTYAGFAARPRYGQLAALNAVRVEHMCDGTMSPLGEFLSLLAYGLSLQRSEGPVYHFDWSEDGQTITWDGDRRLSMRQFRSLAHEAFRQATVQTRRLTYDLEPEVPELGTLRDRLSNTTPGYSFLTDPQNGLKELYLTIFMRACTASVDGILKSHHHDGQGTWDADAAQAYLEGHDALLKTLMVLEQLDSGQAARVSELLTLEQVNTRSRLRGIGIFGGQMFSITRHNKARLTTNREFQVARFLSSQVATLVFQYLVYIRPTAYAILRQCFNQKPVNTLIFTPVAKPTRWTTKVFTDELRRLSQDALGSGLEIGVQLYRQLSIAITERHVRGAIPTFDRFDDRTKTADPDVAFAWQSGHRPMQRHSTYGLDGAFPDQLQPSLLRLYARCSERWHDFLMIGPDASCNDEPASHWPESDISSHQGSRLGLDFRKRKQPAETPPQGDGRVNIKRRRQQESNTGSAEEPSSSPTSSCILSDRTAEGHAAELTIRDPLATGNSNSHHINSPTIQSYGPFVHLTEFHLLICSVCQRAVLVDEIATHLRGSNHLWNLTPRERQDLFQSIDAIPGLFRSQKSLLQLQRPPVDSQPIPFIRPPKHNGYACHLCPYVVCAEQSMIRHYREKHQWVNNRQRGGRYSKVPERPWRKNVSCQYFFLNYPGCGWFEVCRTT